MDQLWPLALAGGCAWIYRIWADFDAYALGRKNWIAAIGLLIAGTMVPMIGFIALRPSRNFNSWAALAIILQAITVLPLVGTALLPRKPPIAFGLALGAAAYLVVGISGWTQLIRVPGDGITTGWGMMLIPLVSGLAAIGFYWLGMFVGWVISNWRT